MSDFSEARNAIRDLIMDVGQVNEQEMNMQHQAGMERETQEKQRFREGSGNAAKGYQEARQIDNEESRIRGRQNRGLPQVDPSELGLNGPELG